MLTATYKLQQNETGQIKINQHFIYLHSSFMLMSVNDHRINWFNSDGHISKANLMVKFQMCYKCFKSLREIANHCFSSNLNYYKSESEIKSQIFQ